MDYDSSTKFISSLAKFLQSLCNGYVEFDNGVEVIGHIYLNVDTGRKIDYILNEKVCKTDENSVTFISNSFHAQPAEKPKPPSKKGFKSSDTDVKIQDEHLENNGASNSDIEPRSTNFGTVPSRNSQQGVKRPYSPNQKHPKGSSSPPKSGRSSPRPKKSRSELSDPNLSSHASNPASENSVSSAPSPAGDGGGGSSGAGSAHDTAPPGSEYNNESYQQSFFSPADEEGSVADESEERDIKPSIDTDVTFIKEEFAPSSSSCSQSGNQSRDRGQNEDPSLFPSLYNQSYSSPGYSSSYGTSNSQRSNYGAMGDRSSELYSGGQGSSHLEGGDGSTDPAVRHMVQVDEMVRQDDSLEGNDDEVGCPKPVVTSMKRNAPKWADRARKYACHYCWKSFVVKRDWEGHINSVHLKTKPFRCHICSWSSTHRGELQKHVKKCSVEYGHLSVVKPDISATHTSVSEKPS